MQFGWRKRRSRSLGKWMTFKGPLYVLIFCEFCIICVPRTSICISLTPFITGRDSAGDFVIIVGASDWLVPYVAKQRVYGKQRWGSVRQAADRKLIFGRQLRNQIGLIWRSKLNASIRLSMSLMTIIVLSMSFPKSLYRLGSAGGKFHFPDNMDP